MNDVTSYMSQCYMLAIRDLTMSQKLITTGGRATPIAGVHVISRCLHISMHMELLPHYGHLSSAGIIHVMGYLVPCGGSRSHGAHADAHAGVMYECS